MLLHRRYIRDIWNMRSSDYLYEYIIERDRLTILTKPQKCPSTGVIVRKLCGEESIARAVGY